MMGLEALSRGAGDLIAIEESRRSAQAIQQNCEKFGFKQQAEVICGDVRKVLPLLNSWEADVIWADPPYKGQLAEPILRIVDKNHLLAPTGIFVIEHAISLPPPKETDGLEQYDSRRYGHTAVTFFKYKEVTP
jgi:16S rRNA (guanine966-N2)-methyltransferase